jgi:limonene-1,2-epoxide hydrolase
MTEQHGTHGDSWAGFVDAFIAFWEAPAERLDLFRSIASPDIVLRAPGFRSTRGVDAGIAAFERTLAAMPDLTARVHGAAASSDGSLFVEMTFGATIGRRRVEWRNVDRFVIRGGLAVERIAYFDPTRVRRALTSSPRGWRQLARLRFGI